MSIFGNLMLLKERTGPYWRSYQRERKRGNIIHDPDYVPEWYLYKLAKNRVAEARVALDQLVYPPLKTSDQPISEVRELIDAYEALRTLERFMSTVAGPDPLGARERVLTALLGGSEEEFEHERRAAGLDSPLQPPREFGSPGRVQYWIETGRDIDHDDAEALLEHHRKLAYRIDDVERAAREVLDKISEDEVSSVGKEPLRKLRTEIERELPTP